MIEPADLPPDLAQLAREADNPEAAQARTGAQAGADGEAGAAPPPRLDKEIAGTFAMIGAGLGAILPSVREVLNEGQCDQLGQALAPVVVKYNLQRFFVGMKWREEIAAIMVCAPVALALREGIRLDLARMRGAQDARSPRPEAHRDPPQDAPGAERREVLEPVS